MEARDANFETGRLARLDLAPSDPRVDPRLGDARPLWAWLI